MTLNIRSGSLCKKRELYEGVVAPMVTHGADTWDVRSGSLCKKRELYEGVVAPMVTHGTHTWDVRMAERCKLEVTEMKCLRVYAK